MRSDDSFDLDFALSLDLETKKSTKTIKTISIDEEIDTISGQVTDAERTLMIIKSQITDKKNRNSEELRKLKMELEEKQNESEKNVRDCFGNNQIEETSYIQEVDDNISQYQHKFDEGCDQIENMKVLRNQVKGLHTYGKKMDLSRKIATEKHKIREIHISEVLNQQQEEISNQISESNWISKLKILESEIFALQQAKRELLSSTTLREKEIRIQMDSTSRSHESLLTKLRLEAENREKSFITHIKSVEQQLLDEEERKKSETYSFNEQIKQMNQSNSAIKKRGTKQLQLIMKDIEELEKTIQSNSENHGLSRESEEKYINLKESVTNMREFQASLKKEYQKYVSEIRELKANLQNYPGDRKY